ncbi:MAG: hypothetical protein AAF744_01810 [Pseudomonadota bacterium]
MRRGLAWVIAALLPLEALALSCMEPSIARTFQQTSDAAQDYLIVEGRLTLDVRDLPKTNFGTPSRQPLTLVTAHLTGKSLSASGFNVPFERDITLEVACFGPWCGSARNGEEVLAFVKRDGDTYALAIDPCGGDVFANQPKLRRQAMACARGGACR